MTVHIFVNTLLVVVAMQAVVHNLLLDAGMHVIVTKVMPIDTATYAIVMNVLLVKLTIHNAIFHNLFMDVACTASLTTFL